LSKTNEQANALKAQANAQFSAKNYPEATKLYGEAIALDPTNHVLYSNRSASRSGAKDYEGALEDAEKVCITILGTATDNSVSRSSPPLARVSPEKEQLCTDSVNTPKLSWLTKPV